MINPQSAHGLSPVPPAPAPPAPGSGAPAAAPPPQRRRPWRRPWEDGVGARWVPRGCPGAPKNQAGMGGFGWKLAESCRNIT